MTWRRSSRCDSSACVEVWTVSSHSGGTNCVQVGYRTSSQCGGGECVEVGFHKSSHSSADACCVEVGTCTCDGVHVRDSKDPGGPVLSFNRDGWSAFLAGAKAGEFDL